MYAFQTMPLVRMIVSAKLSPAVPDKDAYVNTLYFNVSGSVDDPDYQNLVNDLYALWETKRWAHGRYLDIRAYNMDDAKPRPIKAQKQGTASGTIKYGPGQIAVCLSYYADRNLPRSRGRIYLGPWVIATGTDATRPTLTDQNEVLNFGVALGAIGGLNVDWSVYSETENQHARINHVWVDNAYDAMRSRQLSGTSRVTATLNG